jgi:RimJ/RimL family protein N-acetyltransferase
VYEIAIERLESAAQLFPGNKLSIALASIASGNTGGRLWSLDETDLTQLTLFWDQGNNVFYLGGHNTSATAEQALCRLVRDVVRQQAIEIGAIYFSSRAMSSDMQPLLQSAFADHLHLQRPMLFYLYEQPAICTSWPLAPDIQLLPIDQSLLTATDYRNLVPIRAEISWMWPSIERFLEHGWGVAAVHRNETAVCWVTAEYVSARQCAVGIETSPEFRQQGIATAAAARFVAESLQRGVQVGWECEADNPPSVRLAEKLGFTLVERYDFLSGNFRS